MDFFSSSFKLGILGGGQLGKMLLYTTRKWDITTYVLDPSKEAPSKLASNIFQEGDLMDFDTVYQFGKQVDVLTIEIENVNIEALEKLEKEGVKVYPQPHVLRTIQNKCVQKDFYQKNEIPTASYINYDSIQHLKKDIELNKRPFPFIWKAASMGYDGYGVKVIKNIEEVNQLPEGVCLVEDKIDIGLELAVIFCRNKDGMVKNYPVVEMEFHPESNQLEYLICPARIDKKVEEKAIEVAQKVSKSYGHIGLLAIELFLTKKGDILVNEVAPRPHNSGHYSIEAAYTSQFEQHIRAVLNLPLGDTASKMSGIMVNLVGEEGHKGQVHYQNIDKILNMSGVTPHIYGKKETRPFRKMGHVTIVNPDIEKAYQTAKQIKEELKVVSKK